MSSDETPGTRLLANIALGGIAVTMALALLFAFLVGGAR